MRVDLHLHSCVSDGDLTPEELVRECARTGLAVIAITDHDTAAGVEDAQAAASSLPITVVPGIEVTTRCEEHELHILGYWIDPRAGVVQEHQHASVLRRMRRMEGMVERLQDQGLPITIEDVVDAAGPHVQSIGRPHLARALFESGLTRYYGEAFARWIGDGGPAFVNQPFPPPADAIALIHAAGGVAVWAHPPAQLAPRLMTDMAGWGLDGVECFRPNFAPPEERALVALARRHSLFTTGGSDWHGPHRGPPGEFSLPAIRLREILSIGGIAVGSEGE